MEIGLLAAACGAELQSLFQGEVGPSLAQSVGLKGAGRVGECQLAFVVLSSERGWQTLGFWSQDWLGWLLEKFPLSFSNTFTPKLASNHSLSVCPGSTGQQRFRQWYLLVKDGGRLSSQLPRNIHPLHGIQHLCFYVFSLPTFLCLPELQGWSPGWSFWKKKCGEPTWRCGLQRSLSALPLPDPDNRLNEMAMHRKGSKLLFLFIIFND